MTGNQPLPEDFPTLLFKHADINYVMDNTTPYVRGVLQEFMGSEFWNLRSRFRFCSVDLKVHDLKQGEYPCIPGWHQDTSQGTLEELYFLYVTGHHALTEFKTPEGEVFAIPSCQWYGYRSEDWHRGPAATGEGKRILVRVAFQSFLSPRFRVYKEKEWDTYSDHGPIR